MSHGSDNLPDSQASGFLTTRPRLRSLALAVGALIVWLGLDTALSLVSPEYPIGPQTATPNVVSLLLGCFIALAALLIAALLTGFDGARFLIFYIVGGSLTLICVNLSGEFVNSTETQDSMKSGAAVIVGSFALLATAATFAKSASLTFTEQLGLNLPERRRFLAFAVPIAIWFGVIIVWPFTPFNPVIHPEAPDTVALIHAAVGSNLVVVLAYLAILVPIGEELVFRGIVTPFLAKSTNVVFGIAISSLIFALFHIDPEYFSINQVILVFLLGAILATVVTITRSIWPAIALHAVNNALVTVQSIYL